MFYIAPHLIIDIRLLKLFFPVPNFGYGGGWGYKFQEGHHTAAVGDMEEDLECFLISEFVANSRDYGHRTKV